MSDPASPAPAPEPQPQPVNYITPATAAGDELRESSPLLRLSGLLGLVACLSGFLVLLAGCAGMNLFRAAPYILFAGAAGLVLGFVAAAVHRRRIAAEETHLLLAFFANVISILGGLLELAVLKGWPLLPK